MTTIIPPSRLREILDLPEWRFINHTLRKRAILKEIRNYPVGLRVLDVGCAFGDIAIEAAAMGYQVKGIELQESRVETAHRLAAEFGVDAIFEVSDAARLSKLEETYDLIILGEILEHFYEPWKILEEIEPLCTSNAHIIATTPNTASLRARLKLLFLGMFPDQNPQHLYFFTKRRFQQMLARSQFEIERCRTIAPMLIQNLGPLTVVERAFWKVVNGIVGGLGENLLVVCRLRGADEGPTETMSGTETSG